MRLLNKNKSIVYLIYFLHIIIFAFGNLLISNADYIVIFDLVFVFSLQFFILLLFKLDFIFFLTFLITYLLFPSVLVYYNLETKNLGLLSIYKNSIYLKDISIYVYVFIFIISFLAFIFNFLKNEEKLLNGDQLPLRNITIFINNLLIYIFTIVAFPRLNMDPQNRFKMLLPGSAWNQLVIVLILFNLPYITKRKSVMCSTLFAVVWFSLNGERADISGLALGMMIMVMLSRKVSKKIKLVSISLFLSFSLIYILIGQLRTNSLGSFSELLTSIGTFSTVSDVSYLLNISVDYLKTIGSTHGSAVMGILESFIPFTYKPSISFIDKYYANPGGVPLIAPMIFDGGTKIISVVSVVLSSLLSLLIKSANKNLFVRMEFIIILCSIPRICWYGVYYVGPGCIFFVPFVYILDNLLNRNSFYK